MKRVLVVEDDPIIRSLIVEVLQEVGHDTLQAEDGFSGVQLAQSEQPDVVLMDLMLPVLDGTEAIRRLKSDPATCAIPTIAMSASYTRLHAEDLPADAVLAKPFDLSALLNLVTGETQSTG